MKISLDAEYTFSLPTSYSSQEYIGISCRAVRVQLACRLRYQKRKFVGTPQEENERIKMLSWWLTLME
jgi:hypothetical protein